MNINSILKKKLCSGCGACTVVCPQDCIGLVAGKRVNYPEVQESSCLQCGKCLLACPGEAFLRRLENNDTDYSRLGRHISCHVAYSRNEQVRYEASSGGVVSSLLTFLIEGQTVDGAICVRQSTQNALFNETVIVYDSGEVKNIYGSRYSPASVCPAIKSVLSGEKKYAFVGKPCEIEALKRLETLIPGLKNRIYIKIAIMCASSPSRDGINDILRNLHINAGDVSRLKYRGKGWPGFLQIDMINGEKYSISYNTAWDTCLSKHVPTRCRLCNDPFAVFSDITVGDAWDEQLLSKKSNGYSAVILRTDRGRAVYDAAAAVHIHNDSDISNKEVEKFQKNLMRKIKNNEINHPAYSRAYGITLPAVKSINAGNGSFSNNLELYKRTFKYFLQKVAVREYV